MAKQLAELTVQKSGNPIWFARPANADFITGRRPHVQLDTISEKWVTVGKAMIVLGIAALIAFIGLLAYIAIWNSSLAVETTGTIDGVSNGILYHYTVDGTRYDKVERANRFVSNWDEGGVPEPVVYLSFWPSESRLAFNVEGIKWIDAIFLIGGLALIPWGGRNIIRHHQRMIELRDEATHVLEAKVVQVIRGAKGVMTYVYTAPSPVTGKEIRGTFDIGRLNSNFGRVGVGSTVAVLYRSDKLHTIL
jgi:hypothetical protein